MMQQNESQLRLADERSPAEEQNERLQLLVGELLRTNQELRYKLAQLEQQAESVEQGRYPASAWSGLTV